MDKWKAELLVKMRINKITQRELAAKMGVTEEYISMIFNGSRNPAQGETRLNEAVDSIIAARSFYEAFDPAT